MKDFFKYLLATITGIIISTILFFTIITGIIIGLASSSENKTVIETPSILHLNINGTIVDRNINDPFEDLNIPGMNESPKTYGLNQILKALDKAKTDPSIKGIFLNPGILNTGFATISELREALVDFKTSGKPIIAYQGNMPQASYYLCSVADKIYINPQGILEIKGLAAQRTFYKNTLEKLGIEVTVIKHGKYKSAVEPFIQEKMSSASREQTTAYLKSIWAEYKRVICTSRPVTPYILDEFADKGMMLSKPELAVQMQLIDGTRYMDEIQNELRNILSISQNEKLPLIQLKKYLSTTNSTSEFFKDKIAIIYASGGIDDMSSDGINSSKLSETIRKAREDRFTKAIVLRINSPGGSAYGSEQIWREVKLAKEQKPLIVSMGDMAASGGYYIACAADSIIAEPTTITGSIGIFGLFPNIAGLSDKIGLSYDQVSTNKLSDFGRLSKPLSMQEKNLLQAYIERGYDTFIDRCAEGRHMTKAAIDSIGQGRVWTGEMALEIGLVDKLGNLKDAISMAAEKAEISSYRIQELPEKKTMLEELFTDLSGEVSEKIIQMYLQENYSVYKNIKQIKNTNGIQARIPYDVEIY